MKVSQRLYNYLFASSNALPGQLAMAAIGVLLTMGDAIMFRVAHNVTIALAMVVAAAVISSRLPATLHDRVQESQDEWFLTFTGPIVYGTGFGATLVLVLHPGLTVGFGPLSSLFSITALIAMQLAFTHASQMSREVRFGFMIAKMGPGRGFHLKAVVVCLKVGKHHQKADEIVTAFCACDPGGEELVRSYGKELNPKMVEQAAGQYKELLYG